MSAPSSLNFLDPNGTDVVPIAPELMGDEGLPPRSTDHDSSSIDTGAAAGSQVKGDATGASNAAGGSAPAPDYPGFASSNTRGGDQHQPWSEDDQYAGWENTADYHPFAEHPSNDAGTLAHPPADSAAEQEAKGTDNEGEGDGERKKKRPRVVKPRKSKIDKEDPLEGVDVEWEDPNQDPKAGPVFVHPPPGTAQACVRCHRIKRKCDQARPRCQGCSKADVPCVFELSPATSTYLSKLKTERNTLHADLTSAHDRITLLETALNSLERGESMNVDPSAGLDSALMGSSTFEDRAHYEKQFQHTDIGHDDFNNLARTILSVRGDSFADASGSVATHLPPLAEIDALLDTCASKFSTVLPWLDLEQAKKDLRSVYEGHSHPREFALWMALALGADSHHGPRYKEKAMSLLSAAMSKEDLNAVEGLILLTVYKLVTPLESSPWQLVGIVSRIAADLDLARPADAGEPSAVVDRRINVMCSLYSIEQALASALGKAGTTHLPDDVIPAVPANHSMASLVRFHRYSAQINSLMETPAPRAVLQTLGRGGFGPYSGAVDAIDALEDGLNSVPLAPWMKAQIYRLKALIALPNKRDPSITSTKLQNAHAALVLYVELAQSEKLEGAIAGDAADNTNLAYTLVALLYVLCVYDQRASGISSTAGWKNEVKKRLAQVNGLKARLGDGAGSGKLKTALDSLYGLLESKYVVASGSSNEGMDALVDAIGGQVDLSRVVLPETGSGVGNSEVDEIWKGLWKNRTLWGAMATVGQQAEGVWLI